MSAIAVMVLSGAAIGYFASSNAAKAVAVVSARLRNEVSRRVTDHLRAELTLPAAVLDNIADGLHSGMLSLDDPRLPLALVHRARTFPPITSLYVGTPRGGLIGGGHEGDGTSFYVTKTPDLAAGPFVKSRLTAEGRPGDVIVTVPNFDARTRPWFMGAVAEPRARPVWGDIYGLFTGQDMALPVSRAVRDPATGDLLGVVGGDVFLSQLSGFLTDLHTVTPGLTYIVDGRGLLVASSTGAPLFSQDPQGRPQARLDARDSTNPLIAQSARIIPGLPPHPGSDGARNRKTPPTPPPGDPTDIISRDLALNDADYFVRIVPFSLDGGLSWRVITVIPAQTFLDPVRAGTLRSGLLIALSVVVMGLVMGLVAGRILRPLAALTRSVEAVAAGDLSQRLEITRDDEIGSLARAFNTMTRRLEETSADRDRKFAAISAAEARYATLFDTADMPLISKDLTGVLAMMEAYRAQGVQDLRAHLADHPDRVARFYDAMEILQVNQATLRLFEAPSSAVLIDRLPGLMGPGSLEVFINELCAIWSGADTFASDIALKTLSGKDIWCALSFRVPATPEGFASLPVSLLDITARRRAETTLREKKEELERSNAELESFAYVSAHDLREPLRNITSYTTLLSRRLADRLTPEERDFFAFVHSGALHMNDLVCDLLDFSRVGRGQVEAMEPVPMDEVARKARSLFSAQITETQAIITLDDPLPRVLGHRDDLERVIVNLLGNALKYRAADRPPRIRVTATPLERSDQSAPRFWRFEIRDNGIGIAPDHGFEDRVFGLFQRLHRRDEHGGGTGIGLAICKKVIERHGGRIWVTSSGLDQGCCFSFTLPEAPPDQDQDRAEATTGSVLARARPTPVSAAANADAPDA